MTQSSYDQLSAILDGLQARLEGKLSGGRRAVAHPGARGQSSEDDWLSLLEAHLPRRYQADRAFVIDSRGQCSDQIDVVICDRHYSPFLYNQVNQRYIPAESVYAVFEVKQSLSRRTVQYAGRKAASVRRLYRTSAPIKHIGGVSDPSPPQRIVAGILAYQSEWNPPFGDALRHSLQDRHEDEQLDLGCALIHGVFEARYLCQDGVELHLDEGSRSLVHFLLRLLQLLQLMGTAPAINYDAYLTRFKHG